MPYGTCKLQLSILTSLGNVLSLRLILCHPFKSGSTCFGHIGIVKMLEKFFWCTVFQNCNTE